jgi:hypothetical protein
LGGQGKTAVWLCAWNLLTSMKEDHKSGIEVLCQRTQNKARGTGDRQAGEADASPLTVNPEAEATQVVA